jgi:hypothetical protein
VSRQQIKKKKEQKMLLSIEYVTSSSFLFPLDNGQSTLYFLDYSKRVSLVAMATYTNVEIVSFISQVRYTPIRPCRETIPRELRSIHHPSADFYTRYFFHFYFCVQLEIAQRARRQVKRKKLLDVDAFV